MSARQYDETTFLIREGNKDVRCHCHMDFRRDPPEQIVELVIGETGSRTIIIEEQELPHVLEVLQKAAEFLEARHTEA